MPRDRRIQATGSPPPAGMQVEFRTAGELAIRRKIALGLALGGVLALAGCGYSSGTRAVTGGLLGAGAGVAAATHGKSATGALIGGGIGAVGGALTAP
jgi:osmotically inducible lipoprotein OsmB